ncbi:MAG: transcriptional repressor NrdR [Clostridia bacterium]|nr:transcriptional repressor NrdR [Clostridia bacterium]
MKCPYCGFAESKVIDSRRLEETNSIKRRRECLACEKRFSTYERVELAPLVVIKKNGDREQFDRQKLLRGIMHACEKRPVSIDMMEKLVSEVETTLNNELMQEVESERIGELVMDKLKEVDEVAYVRFASVYRQFRDINTFMEELQKLLK